LRTFFLAVLSVLVCRVSSTFAQAGALDNSFNGTGKVTTRVGNLDGFGECAVVQPDGKIVVAGYATNGINYEFAVVRYNTDGSLDNTFGSNGQVITYFPDSDSYGYAVALQADGKIVVAGTSYDGEQLYDDFALARYNTDGSLDNTFGIGGLVTTDFGNSDDYGLSVAIKTNGKIVVGGSSDIYNVPDNVSAFALVCYNTNGSIDTGFGTKGLVATNFYSSDNYGHSIAIQPDGKIVVAGSSANTDTIVSVALMRYDSTGSIDSSFGVSGIDTTVIGTNASASAVALQPDGKIVVAGYADNNFAVLRYTTTGILDTTFGAGGKDTTGFGNFLAIGNAVAIQPDSAIVVAGSIGSAFALARYKANGVIDSAFGTNVKITTPFTGIDDEALTVALQPDGKIIAAGFTEVDTVYYFAVARYSPGLLLGIIDVAAPTSLVLIYPNPVQTTATLDYKLANTETLTINLFDITGRLVQTIISNETILAGEHRQTIDMSALAAGSYITTITNSNTQSLSIKIVKE